MNHFINNHFAPAVAPPTVPASDPHKVGLNASSTVVSAPQNTVAALLRDYNYTNRTKGTSAVPILSPSSSSSSLSSMVSSETSGSPPSTPAFKFNRFAPIFVPSWLREIPAPRQFIMLPPAAPFPAASYADDVIPKSFDNPRATSHGIMPSVLLSAPSKRALSPISRPVEQVFCAPQLPYADHFCGLLAQQLQGQLQTMVDAKIYEISLTLDRVEQDTFKIIVPGIREDSPKLAIGDRMTFRGLDTINHLASYDLVEAEVVGLDKLKGGIYVKSRNLGYQHSWMPTDQRGETKYQVQFKASTDAYCDMQDAVRLVGGYLPDDQSTAGRWLWPRDGEFTNPDPITINRYFDDQLNDEQIMAVRKIVTPGHRVPYLISGPPGTGKTKTIVETVLQIIQDPKARVLLCAPSNAAADTLTRRLRTRLSPSQLFRLNSDKRTFAEVPQTILQFCHVGNDKFGLPPMVDLMNIQIVVTTCLDAAILSKARLTNANIQRAREHYEKVHGKGTEPGPAPLHWTHLLIDEAAQASEPETLVPIEVVYPVDYKIADYPEPTVVLCGDVKQLGPVIHSRLARDGRLDRSLLERLFDSPVYPTTKNKFAKFKLGGPASYLVKNYRSMPALLMAPSALFYDDTLEPRAQDVRLIKWSGLVNPDVPIAIKGIETEEATIDEGASWYNLGEIDEVVRTIVTLQRDRPDILAKDIAVITPWREQVWRIRTRLRSIGLHGVDVGHVESYQGAEFKVTILSCVRSNARFLASDRKASMGFFNEPKRFNVAITRAKELLVVIGNMNLFKHDEDWLGFLKIATRKNLYQGPALDITVKYRERWNFIESVEDHYVNVRGRKEACPWNF